MLRAKDHKNWHADQHNPALNLADNDQFTQMSFFQRLGRFNWRTAGGKTTSE